MLSGRQAVKVMVSLVGDQNVAVAAHQSGTEDAALGVRVGGTLIYILDAETARGFYRAWQSGARQARPLPVKSDPTAVMPVAGVGEPVVMMEAADTPPAVARLVSAPGRPPSLWVTLGRIVFDVHDHRALRSTMAAFRRAEKLATTTFPPTAEQIAGEQAARTAARLFTAAAPDKVPPARRPVAAQPLPVRSVQATAGRAL